MNDKRAKDIMTTDVIVANKNDNLWNRHNEKRIPCGFSKDVKFHTRDNIFRWYEEVWRWDESNSSI